MKMPETSSPPPSSSSPQGHVRTYKEILLDSGSNKVTHYSECVLPVGTAAGHQPRVVQPCPT